MFNILFLLVGIGNILAVFKINQQALFQLSVQVYSLLGQTKGERRAIFEGHKKVRRHCEITPKNT